VRLPVARIATDADGPQGRVNQGDMVILGLTEGGAEAVTLIDNPGNRR